MNREEMLPLVDLQGNVIGQASRRECHSGSFLLHPVVHLHIIAPDGRILLQLRSASKDIQPGRWDTAVGGHVDPGETVVQALYREVCEELGLTNFEPQHMATYPFRSDREYELVNTYCWHAPDDDLSRYSFDREEIDAVRFWSVEEIKHAMGQGILTGNFEQEFNKLITQF